MTEKETMNYIEELGKKGSVLGLKSVRELAGRMGNPQDDLKVIHIAGTNGKGSILAYISTILKTAGYKTGRYLSPVISEYREKIQVNEKPITKKGLQEGMELIKNCIDSMLQEGLPSPTLFEVETVLAFWYFKKMQCDFVVLETGMGGETDATNIVKEPLLCVFASISMDHMAFLGNTLEKIASVKAGIIQNGTTVVSVQQPAEVEKVLRDKAASLDCPIIFAENPQKIKYGIETQSFQYKEYKKCRIHLAGVWQMENASVALEVIHQMKLLGYSMKESEVLKGLEDTVWYGRFSVLQKKPLLIADGAHNRDAARRLRESLVTYLSDRPLIYIMGVLKDKEYDSILEQTADLASHIVTITPPNKERALPAYELAQTAGKYCNSVTSADSLEEAVEMASLLAGKECAIICFGSLSYLGDLKRLIEKKNK